MKYYIIAGEASGDLYGSNLVRELKLKDSKADIRAWGGDLIQEQGVDLIKHYKDHNYMGFLEVVRNLGTILKNIDFCKKILKNSIQMHLF
jgi:lipid-A-disaccharide synthase